MPLPRVSLRSFLSSAKVSLQSSIQQTPSSPITFVIGNESADLDSLCSALVLAYLRTYAPLPSSLKQPNTLYIPISNLARHDLSLRPELHPVLSRANIQPSDLITLSDLPSFSTLGTHLPPQSTRWLLVDHNSMTGALGKVYGQRVVGVIDHHDEEGVVPRECPGEMRVVRKSGSCASLVVEWAREGWDALSERGNGNGDRDGKGWDRELAYVALAPVLIDTTDLKSEDKVTEADREAVKYLRGKIAGEVGSESVEAGDDGYFNEVSSAKQDIGRLSLSDILRKDYKQWSEGDSILLGVSSIVKDIKFLVSKAGSEDKFISIVKEFATERRLSICAIMTTANHEDGFKRELFVWALDDNGVEAVKRFEGDATEKLGLRPWGDGKLDDDSSLRRCWWQDRVENSRKQVAPLLRGAITK